MARRNSDSCFNAPHVLPLLGCDLVELERVEDAGVAHDRVQPTKPIDTRRDDRGSAVGSVDRVVRGNRRAERGRERRAGRARDLRR
jgi:hypothetical protein